MGGAGWRVDRRQRTYRGVVGDGFQILALPAANPMEKFHPKTATYESASIPKLNPIEVSVSYGGGHTGKLNAVSIPTTPRGFGTED